MNVSKKLGHAAKITLAAHEKRILARAAELCTMIWGNTPTGDLNTAAMEAAKALAVIQMHLCGEQE